MSIPGVLVVLDGWGHVPQGGDYDGIGLAPTPVLDQLLKKHPVSVLHASGRAVGLPSDAVGNSEIGHMTIGAGRQLEYESSRVERAASQGELATNLKLQTLFASVKASGGALHLLGLCSDGMVHSHVEHFGVLLDAARSAGVSDIFLHPSTDGRDVSEGTAALHLTNLMNIAESAGATIATVVGRNYTMDRDANWDLTRAAYALFTYGIGEQVKHPLDAIKNAAAADLGDQWMRPSVVIDDGGQPVGRISDGDGLIFVNFRGDRMRQIVRAFTATDFTEFERDSALRIGVLTLTEYFLIPSVSAVLEQTDASGGLSDLLEYHGICNSRVAESEKYPHITFFMNGRDARKRALERNTHVPSPKGQDYRKIPELSAAEVTDNIVASIADPNISLVVANLANADVIAHTGDLKAVEKAVATVDRCLKRICEAAQYAGRWVALVGDHGNAEVMWNPDTGTAHVGHTTNPVPFVLIDPNRELKLKPEGTLADVAPTLLEQLGVAPGPRMTGENLVHKPNTTGFTGGKR